MTEEEIHRAIELEAYYIWKKMKAWELPNADDDKANCERCMVYLEARGEAEYDSKKEEGI